MSEKIAGYAFLAIGLAIILFSAFNVYQTFTGKSEPIQPFNLEGIGLDFSSFLVGDASPEELAQLKTENNDLKTELVSPDLVNRPMNLFAHFMLLGFFVNVGFKIGLLGANILRPVKIDVGENKIMKALNRANKKQQEEAPKIQ